MKGMSRRKFMMGAGAALVGGAALATGCAPAATTAQAAGATAGTGSANGKGGELVVEAVAENGELKRLSAVSSRESFGIGTEAMDVLSSLIVENQTLDVDAVSGATMTSMAFLSAAEEAMKNAGLEVKSFKKAEHAYPSLPDAFDGTADVVVIGSGGAGYAAAITAAMEGKKTVMLEKLGITGGDTILSGGAMAVPGNWFQEKEGIDDSVEKMAQDMLVGGDNMGDPALVDVICKGAYNAMEWLIFEGGVAWQPYERFFGGHSVPRSIIPEGNEGSGIIVALNKRAEGLKNLVICRNVKAEDLERASDGSITGVKASNMLTGEEYAISCKAVVMAAGGFGSNVEMRVKYNPEMDESILSTDSVGATGDCHVMAEEAGAELIDMQYIQTYPTCDTESGALLYVGNMRLENRALCVNKEGKRFVEEMERRDVISNAIKKQTDGVGYMVFNQEGADATDVLQVNAAEYDGLVARKQLVKADTLEEACEAFGIDAAALADTLEKWNGYCAAGSDPDFNYRAAMHPIEGGPYYVMAFKPSVHYTMGGVRIDPEAHVLDTEGKPIEGLFAAGETAGHKMGTNRLGSCSITDVFVFGRIAGRNAAAMA